MGFRPDIVVLTTFFTFSVTTSYRIFTVQEKGNRPITSNGCREEGHFFPNYEFCGVYHRCSLAGKNTWTLKTLHCPDGQSFVEEFQSCERIPCEAREPWAEASPYLPCDQYSQFRKFQVPGDCNLYYVCIWAGSHFTYKIEKCVGGFFNERLKKCENTLKCPQVIHFLPPRTGEYGMEHYAHPESCNKYYVLHPCFDAKGKRNTCVRESECPTGLVYHAGLKKDYCAVGNCEVEVVQHI